MAAPLKISKVLFKIRKCIQYAQCRRYSIDPPHSLYPVKKVNYIIEDIDNYKTWEQIQKEIKEQEKENFPEPADIGVEKKEQTLDRALARKQMQQNKHNKEMEQAARLLKLEVPLDEVKAGYSLEQRPNHTLTIAQHYGIYDDLFNGAFFLPVMDLGVYFECDEETVMPVCTGNRISPDEARSVPLVEFAAAEDSLWTLIMTNPDGHLTDNESEYIHWMVGNICGSDLSTGEVLCDYLQPFPPKGTGFHRHIFVLFKQEAVIDYSKERRSPNCTNLKDRTFKTVDFCRQHSENLTPMGLCFFQSEYDETVRDIYHHTLNMKEPVFEFAHPLHYRAVQKKYPKRQPFDRYFDRYRDKKDIAEEVLRIKLDMMSPFTGYKEQPKYPLVHIPHSNRLEYIPTWLKKKEELMHRRVEQFSDLPK